MKNDSYETVNVVAAVIAAYKINNNIIVKDAVYDNGKVTAYSNKSYLYSTFCENFNTGYPLPDKISLTEDLLADAVETILSLDKIVTMTTLTKGKINSFIEGIYNILQKDKIRIKDFGLLVWLPKVIDDYNKVQTTKEISAYYEMTSKFFGKIGDRIALNFNLIEKRYVRQIDAWSAYGHTSDGNLTSFLTKKEELACSGKIYGRVRSHDVSKFHNNAKVTILNHVKAK